MWSHYVSKMNEFISSDSILQWCCEFNCCRIDALILVSIHEILSIFANTRSQKLRFSLCRLSLMSRFQLHTLQLGKPAPPSALLLSPFSRHLLYIFSPILPPQLCPKGLHHVIWVRSSACQIYQVGVLSVLPVLVVWSFCDSNEAYLRLAVEPSRSLLLWHGTIFQRT